MDKATAIQKWREKYKGMKPDYTKVIEIAFRHLSPTALQEVYTPPMLAQAMVIKGLEVNPNLPNGTVAVFNLEFIPFLLEVGCSPQNITFLSDEEHKGKIAEKLYNVNVVKVGYDRPVPLFKGGVKTEMEPEMQFDNVLMNPPYQAPQVIKNDKGITGGGATLWDKFLELALHQLVKDGGFVLSVNPSGYRTPNHRLWSEIRKALVYLEMHDHKDGQKTFGKGTRYDVIICKKNRSGKTIVVDELGQKHEIDLNDWAFLPNCFLDIFGKLIAKDGEPRAEMLFSRSTYGHDKPWTNKQKYDKFIHPCVYMINAKNEPTFYWANRNDNGHFGVPKVVFASGCSSGFLLDATGEYGLTEFARAIVDTPENLPGIYQAFMSDRWKKVRRALFIAENSVCKDIFSHLRKDFWKEFI